MTNEYPSDRTIMITVGDYLKYEYGIGITYDTCEITIKKIRLPMRDAVQPLGECEFEKRTVTAKAVDFIRGNGRAFDEDELNAVVLKCDERIEKKLQ